MMNNPFQSFESSPLRCLVILIMGTIGFLLKTPCAGARNYGPHEGYLVSTENERSMQVTDMEVFQPPASEGLTLRERIFNDKLSREFRERYEEKFGRTEVERVYYSPNKFTYYDDLYSMQGTVQHVSDERRRFGEFMIRRLTEYHIDNYTKTSPRARAVWEVKERMSNLKMEVSKVRFDFAYSIAGNTLDMKILNPWVQSKVVLSMDPERVGPAPTEELQLSLMKPIDKTTSVESHYKTIDGVVSLTGRHLLSPVLGASVTTSTFTKARGKTVRESLYLAGVTYIF